MSSNKDDLDDEIYANQSFDWGSFLGVLRKVLGMDDRLLLSSCPASPGLDLVVDHRDRIRWMDQVERCPGISLILVLLPLLPLLLQANVRCD